MATWMEISIIHDGKPRPQYINVDVYRLVPIKRGTLLVPQSGDPLTSDEPYLAIKQRIEGGLSRITKQKLEELFREKN